jgi:hypothetical protein
VRDVRHTAGSSSSYSSARSQSRGLEIKGNPYAYFFRNRATGFIGSAIVQELIGAGHKVLGLSHNDASAKALAKLKVEAHQGDLKDTDSLAAGAEACDGVIHTPYLQDFSDMAVNSETKRHSA